MSGILASYTSPQRRAPLGRERANRRRPDAHDPSGLFRAVAEDLGENDRRALTRWKLSQHPAHVLADVHVIERIPRACDRYEPWRGRAGATHPHPGPVETAAEEGGHGIVELVDPVPLLPHLRECVLH